MRTTCPAGVSSLIWSNNNIRNLIKLTVALIKQFSLLLLHSSCTSILISTLFNPAFNPSSCLRAEDQVSERYPKIGNVTKTTVLWDVSRCSLLQRHRCFGVTYCHNLYWKTRIYVWVLVIKCCRILLYLFTDIKCWKQLLLYGNNFAIL